MVEHGISILGVEVFKVCWTSPLVLIVGHAVRAVVGEDAFLAAVEVGAVCRDTDEGQCCCLGMENIGMCGGANRVQLVRQEFCTNDCVRVYVEREEGV